MAAQRSSFVEWATWMTSIVALVASVGSVVYTVNSNRDDQLTADRRVEIKQFRDDLNALYFATRAYLTCQAENSDSPQTQQDEKCANDITQLRSANLKVGADRAWIDAACGPKISQPGIEFQGVVQGYLRDAASEKDVEAARRKFEEAKERWGPGACIR